MILLVEADSLEGVESILRSMIEAYCDLKNLADIQNYEKKLEVNVMIYEKKLLDEMDKNKNNEFFPKVDVSNLREQGSLYFEKLKKEGIFKETKIFEKMKLSGNEEVYRSVYYMLCQSSHNSINLVEKRFNDVKSVTSVRRRSQLTIDTIAGILTHSIRELEKIFTINLKKEFNSCASILNKMRSSYSSQT